MVLLQRMATKYPGLVFAACLKVCLKACDAVIADRIALKRQVTLIGVARFCFMGVLSFAVAAISVAEPVVKPDEKILPSRPQNNNRQIVPALPVATQDAIEQQAVKDKDAGVQETLSSQLNPARNTDNNPEPDPEADSAGSIKAVSVDKALSYIQSIAQTGAVQLALFNLNRQQPVFSEAPERWLRWERERISLLNLSGNNAALVQRLENLPDKINRSFNFWAKTQLASAYIRLHQYSKARQLLNRIIWQDKLIDSEFNNQWLPHWRRIIIQSYIKEGRVKDAHIAITRFRQDYGQGDIGDIILYARVLLMNNLLDEVLSLLAKHTSNPEAGMLNLLAQLRKGVRSPRIILQSGLRQMQGEWVKPELKIYLWSIVAEAAQRSEDRQAGIKAMEFVFSDKARERLPAGLFTLTIDDLWNAYLENAIHIGNKAQYLVGDDPVWFEAAQAFSDSQGIQARSLYAFLMLRGQDSKIKRLATQSFLKSLSSNVYASELVSRLFLSSRRFKTKEATPVVVRHFLVDYALAKKDIRLASELMASIKSSPQGADKFMWSLRRARVLVMGGKAKQGSDALVTLLAEHKNITTEETDKLMQVVFDLQTVKANDLAFRVFKSILLHVNDLKRRREIYYWMADSKNAQMKFAEAASLYLKSAMLPENNMLEGASEQLADNGFDASFDPWGQTARYQAASNLAKAGLVADARALYLSLLEVTKDKSRIKLLKHELQQLNLLENQFTE